MKIYIDFSIFDSPVSAYGNVTGYIELPLLPVIGDDVFLYTPRIGDGIFLFKEDISQPDIEFPGHLRVMSIVPAVTKEETNRRIDPIVRLEEVVMNSKEAARRLATKLIAECGLFCDEYH